MPWKAEEFGPPYHRAFTGIVNLAGLPGISIPADPSPDGLPIGFQLVAPFGADWRLVAISEGWAEFQNLRFPDIRYRSEARDLQASPSSSTKNGF